jgi:hypothetical protein
VFVRFWKPKRNGEQTGPTAADCSCFLGIKFWGFELVCRERERERERENQADRRGGGLERKTELETGGVRSVFLEDGKYNAGSCGTWNSNAGSGGFCQASAFAVVVVFPWW